MGRVKCDHIKRLITLTSDNIKRLSLYFEILEFKAIILCKVNHGTISFMDLDQGSEKIIFELVLTTFEPSAIF